MKKFILFTLLSLALLIFTPLTFAAQDDDVTVSWAESGDRLFVLKVAYVQDGAAGTAAHDLEPDALDIIEDSFIYLIYVDKTSTDTPELDIKTGTSPAVTLVDIDNIDDGWYTPDDFGLDGRMAPVVESLQINISDAGADTETVTLLIYFYLDKPYH